MADTGSSAVNPGADAEGLAEPAEEFPPEQECAVPEATWSQPQYSWCGIRDLFYKGQSSMYVFQGDNMVVNLNCCGVHSLKGSGKPARMPGKGIGIGNAGGGDGGNDGKDGPGHGEGPRDDGHAAGSHRSGGGGGLGGKGKNRERGQNGQDSSTGKGKGVGNPYLPEAVPLPASHEDGHHELDQGAESPALPPGYFLPESDSDSSQGQGEESNHGDHGDGSSPHQSPQSNDSNDADEQHGESDDSDAKTITPDYPYMPRKYTEFSVGEKLRWTARYGHVNKVVHHQKRQCLQHVRNNIYRQKINLRNQQNEQLSFADDWDPDVKKQMQTYTLKGMIVWQPEKGLTCCAF